MTIGENIKQLRKQKHVSQKELATRLGVGQSTLSSWETSVNRADTDTLIRIAEIFNVELHELLTGNYNRSHYKEWVDTTKINLAPLPQPAEQPVGEFRLIPYVKAYRIENEEVLRDIEGDDWVHVSRTGSLVYYNLPSPNLFQRGFYKGLIALVRENARRLMNNAYIVAAIDNGPVSVYRMTIPDETKMDFILDTMDTESIQIFVGEEIKRVKIIGEILEVKHILKSF